jgi:hypothetical protein
MLLALAVVASLAQATPLASAPDTLTAQAHLQPTVPEAVLMAPLVAAPPQPLSGLAPQLVEYSDAYFTRLTIHKWASYLTVPLFVGQYVVGQKLIDGDGSENLRGLHGALAGGVAALFAVNTITGGMNFLESRKDPEGKNRRTIHSVLMLLADVGFVATGMLAQENEHGRGADNGTHRAVALASMGTALISYAIMIPPFRRN